MKAELEKVLSQLKKQMDIDIDIYTPNSEFVVSTNGYPIYTVRNISNIEFKNGIYVDVNLGLTYFSINASYYNLVCIIKGTSEVVANYAYLISEVILGVLFNIEEINPRSNNLRSIIIGEATREQMQTYSQKYFVPSQQMFIVVIETEKANIHEILSFINHYIEETGDWVAQIDERTLAYVRFYSGDMDYNSPMEFVNVLNENLYEETGYRSIMGIGSIAVGLSNVNASYEQAKKSIKMGELICEKRYVHSYKEYILTQLIEDLPSNMAEKYFSLLLDDSALDIIKDAEMQSTAESFLNNSLNISETSRHLFMHRNTLNYRLEKIQKATGLDIKDFSDAVTFRIMTILYKLYKKK